MNHKRIPIALVLFSVWVLVALVDIWVDIIPAATFWKASLTLVILYLLVWFIGVVWKRSNN